MTRRFRSAAIYEGTVRATTHALLQADLVQLFPDLAPPRKGGAAD